MEKRIVQRVRPTLLERPNNDEALDLSDVVEEEDNPDSVGIEKLVTVSTTLLTEPVGAACDVPVIVKWVSGHRHGVRNMWDWHTSKHAAVCLRLGNNTLHDTTRIIWHHRQETNSRWIDGRMCQVSVIESDKVAVHER